MMQLSTDTLQWPGLWDLPMFIVDYETNKIYDKDHPLPPQKTHLDSAKNRCVRLSAVLDLFSEELREEAEWTLRQLQHSFDIGKPIHSTTATSKPSSDTSQMERKVTTYIPSVALMAFAVIWPYCQAFQKMRNAVLDHLNNYAESVCIDCGFVQRDCKCGGHVPSSQMTFLSSSASVKDSGMQTEPMMVVGMQQKVAAPGISVLLPQTYVSPDVRLPITGVQQNSLTMQSTALNHTGVNVNPLTPGVINLPPVLTFPSGCPTSFVNPLSLSSTVSTQSYVSVLRPPLLGSMGVSSTSDVIHAPNANVSDASFETRKRKLDTDVNVAHAAVQTTGKSYVKKMKIRLGDFSASDFKLFKIVGRDSNAKQQASASPQGVAGDGNTLTGAQTASGNPSAFPSSRFSDVKKDVDSTEKRYTAVWKLLEDLSDDESAAGENTSATNDVPMTAPAENNSGSLEAPRKDTDPCSSGPALTAKDSQHFKEESSEQAASAHASDTIPDSNKDSTLNHIDQPMEEEDDTRLVIDTRSKNDNQQAGRETSATVESNDWEYRNGVKEDAEESMRTSVSDGEQPGAALEGKTDDGVSKPSTSALDENKCDALNASVTITTTVAEDPEMPESKVAQNTAETPQPKSTPKPQRVYGKFEYTPTGEHILRCLVPKCSQTFDVKLAAEVHNHVHPGFVPGLDGSDCPMYLQCHHCEFQAPFYHWYDLLRHMREKHAVCLVNSSSEHTCEYCGLGFETKDLLVSHIDFHYSNRYKCVQCGLLLLTWGQVQRHLENCPEKSKQHRAGSVNLGCPFCTFVFHKRNIRNLHLLSHVDKGLACALCDNGVIWDDWKTLRKHYQQKHGKAMLDKISPFGRDLPHRQPPLRCTRAGCDITFKTFALFSNHMCRAHDLVPYTLIKCVQCERCFRSEKSHEWHVKHMHGEERLCDKCDFVASSKAMLMLHVSQKHQEKQHTCTECDKSFVYFHQLRIHMAHHARRSIYPCRRCDLEFTRLAELRAHLRDDHSGDKADGESDEKKTGHSCPECDFHAPTRSAVVQHVRKVHPEVADGTTGTEDEDADHSYFNSKLDLPPQPATPPPLPPRRPHPPSQFSRGLMSRRGRRRGMPTSTVNIYSHADRYVTIADRRERRNQLRVEKEREDQVKRLRRLTCARSRSIDEHRAMGRSRILPDRGSYVSEAADDGTEVSGVTDLSSSLPVSESYPYLDHSYFCPDSSRLEMLWKSGIARSGPPGNPAVDVSAFQECETMLLGLPPSSRGKGRGRGRGRGRGGWTIANRRSVPPTYSGEDVDPIDPAIRDLDLLAESELLLRPAGNYSILQDILGPNCIGTTAQSMAVSTSMQQAASPMKVPGAVPSRVLCAPARPSLASDGGLNDSLSLEDSSAAGPSDLDDIELCEDDYKLFEPRSSQDQSTANAVDDSATTALWKNEAESAVGNTKPFGSEETDLCSEQLDSAAVGRPSLSADELDDETCSAVSEPDADCDHASIPHDDVGDDDVDIGTDAGVSQQNND